MVKFNRNQTPLELVDNTRQVAFSKNIEAQRYVDENSLYKCKYMLNGDDNYPVRDMLKKIYHNKCAYCETKFTRSYINIEHYRPKSKYYFLAYSWSNLLPICQVCNTTKSNHSELSDENLRLKYNNETLQDVQYKTKDYNLVEKPLFIHPDIDDYENLFYFNTKGKMLINTKHRDKKRIEYTIQRSKLNELDLLNRRGEVFEEFENMKNRLLFLFPSVKVESFEQRAEEEIDIFFKDTKEFLAVRKQIIKKLHLFLLCEDEYFINFFEKFILRYTEKIEVYNCD